MAAVWGGGAHTRSRPLGIKTTQPLRHADPSVVVDITVPRQLFAAPAQLPAIRHHRPEALPLLPLQDLSGMRA
jgi:hypothetical protein